MSRPDGVRVSACVLALALAWGCGPGVPTRQSDAAIASPPPRPHAAGDPFLGLVLEDPHGRRIRLADFKERVRVFDIWATWCGPCRATIPQLNVVYEKYRDRGLVVIGVSVDDDASSVLEFE